MNKKVIPNLSRKKLSNIPLSDRCKSIILGSILGDSMLKIYSGYKNARLSMRHSIIQQDYFIWKAEQMAEISSPGSSLITNPSGFSKNNKLLYQSRALESLTEIHDITYKKNVINIKRSWLNHLTPLSLMVWWLDDGSIVGGGTKGMFCTHGFSKESNEMLIDYLKAVWDIDARMGTTTGKTGPLYYIGLSTPSLIKLLMLIMPHIPVKSMIYKAHIRYKDELLQQRWISTMKENMKHIIVENDIVRYGIKKEKEIKF